MSESRQAGRLRKGKERRGEDRLCKGERVGEERSEGEERHLVSVTERQRR